jgi:hypothetical protein
MKLHYEGVNPCRGPLVLWRALTLQSVHHHKCLASNFMAAYQTSWGCPRTRGEITAALIICPHSGAKYVTVWQCCMPLQTRCRNVCAYCSATYHSSTEVHSGAPDDSIRRYVGAIKALLNLHERVSETILHTIVKRNSKILTKGLVPFKIVYNLFQDSMHIAGSVLLLAHLALAAAPPALPPKNQHAH